MKSRPDFLPPKALLEAGLVMSMNEEKHPNQRWKGMPPEEHVGAILRHVLSWLSGEKLDGETGKSHLTHALCRCAMAVEQEMDLKCPDSLKNPLDYPVGTIEDMIGRADGFLGRWDDRVAYDLGKQTTQKYQDLQRALPTCDRVRYTHVEEAPLPAPANEELEAYHAGKLPLDSHRAKVGDIISRNGENPVEVAHISEHFASGRGVLSGLTTHHPHGTYTIHGKEPQRGIDSIKPAQWDAANTAFLAENKKRYEEATRKQSNGDSE